MTREPEEKTEVRLNRSKGAEVLVPCAFCGADTFHEVVHSALLIESIDKSIVDLRDYQIVQCRGCNSLSLRLALLDIDAFFDDKLQEYKSYVFPNRVAGHKRLSHANQFFLPQAISKIYDETYRAFGNEQPILASIGMRALVQAVCSEKKAKGKDLAKQRDDLVAKKHLTPIGAATLHSIRHLGNFSAHEVEANTLSELSVAMDIVEHLLNEIYLLPALFKLSKLPTKRKTNQ